jgi:hypothetical protein
MDDKELLDLLNQVRDSPVALPPQSSTGRTKEATAYDLALREFDLNQAEYDEEMRLLSQPNDENEAWRDAMREQGRL